jgi:3-methyladenine DNA glycosylase AlkD
MNENEKQLIEDFLNKANPKTAKSNKRFFKQGEGSYCKDDILLGIPMPEIKEYVKSIPVFSLNAIYELLSSEYNEARVLGWSLLIRDYNESDILTSSTIKYAGHCGNWNVVDFAALLLSKTLLKKEGHLAVQNLGYEILFSEGNLWTQRFALVLAINLVKANKLNYALDVTERCLDSKEDLIRKPCGWILREISKQSPSLFIQFMQINKHKISSITRSYALEQIPENEKDNYR